MSEVFIGVIGGSGLYEIDNASLVDEVEIETPFGKPSDKFKILDFEGKKVAFLPRHGRGHRITPSELNSHANIWAFKSMGVRQLVSVSAVGSLKEEYEPRMLALPHQLIDRTRLRKNTFFGDGAVGHIGFADPFCKELSASIAQSLEQVGKIKFKKGGTYVCMEGPAFSTRAESHLYRSWGCDLIGMTALPEAKLAREAEIAYAQISMITDYDSWRDHEEGVDVAQVMAVMKDNTDAVKRALPTIIKNISREMKSEAHTAGQFAVMTPRNLIPDETWKKIALFYGKYLDK